MASVTALVYALLHIHTFGHTLWRSGDVYASLPLATELVRLPMSLFLSTPYLPVWAACVQLVVVVGIAELILGRRLTVLALIFGHFAATLAARMLLETVHAGVFGLTPALMHVLDTGPSAATTAVGACVLLAARMNRCAGLLSVSLIAAAIIAPGVDGLEHLVALACGLIVGAGYRVVTSRSVTAAGISGSFKQVAAIVARTVVARAAFRRRVVSLERRVGSAE